MTFGTSADDWNYYFSRNNGNGIFRNMTENRKRSRDDETCEFMPLSKRINNLHINNNLACSHSGSNSASSPEHEMQSSSHSSIELPRPSYDPGVNSSQSPYYTDNKLLFELHLERIQRSGQQFPF